MSKSEHGMNTYICYCKHASYKALFKKKSLCHDYIKSSYASYLLTKIISIMVVIVNYLLSILNRYLVDYMYLETRSDVKKYVMIFDFSSQLTNILITSVITTANFSHFYPLSFLKGDYNDFS